MCLIISSEVGECGSVLKNSGFLRKFEKRKNWVLGGLFIHPAINSLTHTPISLSCLPIYLSLCLFVCVMYRESYLCFSTYSVGFKIHSASRVKGDRLWNVTKERKLCNSRTQSSITQNKIEIIHEVQGFRFEIFELGSHLYRHPEWNKIWQRWIQNANLVYERQMTSVVCCKSVTN